jgi:hypothetical protein
MADLKTTRHLHGVIYEGQQNLKRRKQNISLEDTVKKKNTA